ncbi:phosphoribosylaminoimidazolesuccinocarboxamide synthase [Candidatus Parcubacteria bacterium]|nr:phosphoribosylaminoimidazolesuccinocarboxamide synthase [Candidatus Parcubacteria bacterium]
MVESKIPGASILKRGKVRDIWEIEGNRNLLAIVTSDGISAFDVVLPTSIPGKGMVLNQLSKFWMNYLEDIVPNHLYKTADSSNIFSFSSELRDRVATVKKATVIPFECIVRGHMSGSFWKEYLNEWPDRSYVNILGHYLRPNLRESEEFPAPIFTPSTKSEEGHDMNLSYNGMVENLRMWLYGHSEIRDIVSAEVLAQTLRSTSIALYLAGKEYALKRGIIIADTKFEFGFVGDQLTLIDEVLTPDSSRFWPVDSYRAGGPQKSLDKQYVRDWLVKKAKWNGKLPAPKLPKQVVEKTSEKYIEIFNRLTK